MKDSISGTLSQPFSSVSKAAEVVLPGDMITEHEGISLEWVNPPFNIKHRDV